MTWAMASTAQSPLPHAAQVETPTVPSESLQPAAFPLRLASRWIVAAWGRPSWPTAVDLVVQPSVEQQPAAEQQRVLRSPVVVEMLLQPAVEQRPAAKQRPAMLQRPVEVEQQPMREQQPLREQQPVR